MRKAEAVFDVRIRVKLAEDGGEKQDSEAIRLCLLEDGALDAVQLDVATTSSRNSGLYEIDVFSVVEVDAKTFKAVKAAMGET